MTPTCYFKQLSVSILILFFSSALADPRVLVFESVELVKIFIEPEVFCETLLEPVDFNEFLL